MKKPLLFFLLLLLVRAGSAQCYTVTPIPYAPDSFNAGTPVYMSDDIYSPMIPMPFTFCFYGVAYSSLLIGSNGMVSFDTANAGMNCPWYIGTAIPSPTCPHNAVFFPWQDVVTNNTLLTYYYNVYGTAPNRRFVVTADSARMYGCASTEFYTGEVMLYETSNIIEVHMKQKDLCASWNNGKAVLGLQNSAGTAGAAAPGRNAPTQWTTNNEAWRFTPNCCPVGIADASTATTFSIYPNPATSELHVHSAAGEEFSVSILDNTGRVVRQDQFSAVSERTLQLNNIAPGLYFIRLTGANGETIGVRSQMIE